MNIQQITESLQTVVTNAQGLLMQILPMMITLVAFVVLVPMAKRLLMAGEPDRRSDVDYDEEWEPDLEIGCPECGGELVGTNAGGEPMCQDCGLGIYDVDEQRGVYGSDDDEGERCPDCGHPLIEYRGWPNWCQDCEESKF